MNYFQLMTDLGYFLNDSARLFQYYCLTLRYITIKTMEDNKDLNRIKVMLAEKKRTNKWLAEQLGINPATVSKWCTNSSQPSLDMLSKIAQVLNVDYTELVRIKRNNGNEEK
jgi:DNA-binding Xre family transcriptional regulator